jgi:hypothetical protein
MIEINLTQGVPSSEFSQEFVQGMANRMSLSFLKYGRVMDAIGKVDEIASLEKRLQKYKETGNTEWLMDVANFAMIEFMHKGASAFRATDSHESPGLARTDGGKAQEPHTGDGGKLIEDRRVADLAWKNRTSD